MTQVAAFTGRSGLDPPGLPEASAHFVNRTVDYSRSLTELLLEREPFVALLSLTHGAHGAPPTLAQLSRREKTQAKKALPAAGSPKTGGGASAGLVYEDRPCAESAAIRNAAAMKARLCFGMTAFLLNRWIFAVSASLSSATLI